MKNIPNDIFAQNEQTKNNVNLGENNLTNNEQINTNLNPNPNQTNKIDNVDKINYIINKNLNNTKDSSTTNQPENLDDYIHSTYYFLFLLNHQENCLFRNFYSAFSL